MQKKEFVVFGLGRFGRSVAETLAQSGCEVLVVDDDDDKIKEIADIVTYAVKAKITDKATLASLGISNFDGAIIAMSEDLEASILATILVKELGIPYVLAKAQTELHGKILKKVGADLVVFPEKEMGIHIANNLIMDNFFDAVELSSTCSLMEMDPMDSWIGHSLKEVNIRSKYKVNVIGIRRDDELDITPDVDKPIHKDEAMILIGKNDALNKLRAQKSKETEK
ncbi:potassium channel family protein [Parasporobacterium paucivorans]|uniref:Trk system potassium uptake protein TrkA n=1 Tax=Parasporobacterium paucivorans DSM 15970 TaxID=1122934 RepID=A0A1M6J380_9FIRM|nr:TrkA family potassium uptake protein [Parasporobacterium paucivorans]SHJ40981.1 trk system potassium uptake protein TrkA [Parasporobacterium paucivorans DSM 15970]